MNRKELNQIFYLKNEMRMWQRELDRIEASSLLPGQQIDGMPFSNTNLTSDPTGDRATRLESIKEIINGKKVEVELLTEKIIKYIDSIDDSLMRQIVFYRCVKCYRWNDVAAAIGGQNTPENLSKMFNRAYE